MEGGKFSRSDWFDVRVTVTAFGLSEVTARCTRSQVETGIYAGRGEEWRLTVQEFAFRNSGQNRLTVQEFVSRGS
jgi:hypothetical protein